MCAALTGCRLPGPVHHADVHDRFAGPSLQAWPVVVQMDARRRGQEAAVDYGMPRYRPAPGVARRVPQAVRGDQRITAGVDQAGSRVGRSTLRPSDRSCIGPLSRPGQTYPAACAPPAITASVNLSPSAATKSAGMATGGAFVTLGRQLDLLHRLVASLSYLDHRAPHVDAAAAPPRPAETSMRTRRKGCPARPERVASRVVGQGWGRRESWLKREQALLPGRNAQ